MVNHGLDPRRRQTRRYPILRGVKPGQVISLKEEKRGNELYKGSFQDIRAFELPYRKELRQMGSNPRSHALPGKKSFANDINETLIVELYKGKTARPPRGVFFLLP